MAIPVFPAHVSEDAQLTFPVSVHGLMTRYYRALRGKDVEVVIRPKRKTVSDPQRKYYFGVVVSLIADHCGYDKDEMHELLAMRFLRLEDDPVTGSPRRKHIPESDTEEMSEYVDSCIRFAAEMGVYIPDPGEVAA